MRFLCWLGLHTWGKWSEPNQVDAFNIDPDTNIKTEYTKQEQTCSCVHCNKTISRFY